MLKTTLVKAWMLAAMLAIFTMSLVMLQEGPGAPTGAAAEVSAARAACVRLAVAAWYASSLARCLPAPAFALCAAAALAFAAHSAWPVLLILAAARGAVHGEVAAYYWLFLGLMCTAVVLVIAGAFAGHDH
ncbi:hypothetical protein PVAP13_4NG055400 [Panicum virgatum]|uniref:Uncharacterized protein n=1 Tax=Panicum virgatum TaxID=38727 RepID=A0A8T0SXG7_PANVG|nr:hypothetical protein PVAP13_4NG055400 [Panicum virgatum]